MTFSDLKKHFIQQLSEIYSESESGFIFQIFSEDILNLNAVQQRQFSDQEVSEDIQIQFENIISELKTGKPYLQILGEAEFYGMKFFVDENVLIPRPETEELLEIAIHRIQSLRQGQPDTKCIPPSILTTLERSNPQTLKILDIGTGSGVIPLVLKKHFPDAEVSSVDFSEKALETAKRNAEFHDLKIKFIHADYLKWELDENFDVIISNPPYIGLDEDNEIAISVKEFEPKMALFAPTEDALIFYRKIADDCEKYLNKNGLVFLEINQKLGQETLDLYQNLAHSELIQDLSGNDRFVFGIR
ncbi:protein-(glutamine-N5) methyltransferase, release factor-specific [Chryseobacterium sp. Leaf404]|uniref:peptide chain release factor N(5)-glutamine methyltransferase n=1 Tax=unclassified Chryseobacterium TaxID=2593645 RepID=UPI0006F49649|nr:MULTISPECIES: peptide chain release factor N(5)-glutamine methyltransferase [unclassified Chryseobacterium]KQT17481.1 protein-(glutamine-N5) methyltransferase, release factor-specific [Chryseobacterium sp. Leaf404]